MLRLRILTTFSLYELTLRHSETRINYTGISENEGKLITIRQICKDLIEANNLTVIAAICFFIVKTSHFSDIAGGLVLILRVAFF